MAIEKQNNLSNGKVKRNEEFDFSKLSNSVKTTIATKIKFKKQTTSKVKVTIPPVDGKKVPQPLATPTVRYTDRHEQFNPKVAKEKTPKFNATIKEAEAKARQAVKDFNSEFKGLAHIKLAEQGGDMLPHANQLDALKNTIGKEHTNNLGLSQKNIWSPDDERHNGANSQSDQGPEEELALTDVSGNANII